MKATIKLQEIKKLSLGVELACLELTLEDRDKNLADDKKNYRSPKITFSITSTGISLRLKSEHSIHEIKHLCEWLELTPNSSDFGSNETQLRRYAKEMIKTNRKLNEPKTI